MKYAKTHRVRVIAMKKMMLGLSLLSVAMAHAMISDSSFGQSDYAHYDELMNGLLASALQADQQKVDVYYQDLVREVKSWDEQYVSDKARDCASRLQKAFI